MASPLQPLAVRGDRRVWAVGCLSPSDCADASIAAVAAVGSTDVFVRAASDAERQQPQLASLVACVVAIDDDSDDSEPAAVALGVARVEVDAQSKLRTLFLGTFPGGTDVEVVLMQPNTVQQIRVLGSGDVTVGDHVLAMSGSVALLAASSSDVGVTSTDAMDLTRLDISTTGSGDVQVSLGHVQASTVSLTGASGSISLFTASIHVSPSAVVNSKGSGDVCWSSGDEMNLASLQVSAVSAGDIAVTSASAASSSVCGQLHVQSVGSGDVDVGGVRCETAQVFALGSSDVVVQASDSITGEAFGGGSVRYAGTAPSSIGRSYSGLLATSVKASYRPPTCKLSPALHYRGDDNVLLSGLIGAAPAAPQGEDPEPVSVPSTAEPPLPPPPGSEPHHLNSLLPLGVAALIAALALWRFNGRRSRRRHQHWEEDDEPSEGFGRGRDARDEKQPLASDHHPVYI